LSAGNWVELHRIAREISRSAFSSVISQAQNLNGKPPRERASLTKQKRRECLLFRMPLKKEDIFQAAINGVTTMIEDRLSSYNSPF
jgi:hypothetical protein